MNWSSRALFMRLFFLIQILWCVSACDFINLQSDSFDATNSEVSWAYEGIDELLPGDILVRPNINLFPHTAFVPGGWRYGHAAIVTVGARHSNPDSLLAACFIIESDPLMVNPQLQVREIPGLNLGDEAEEYQNTFGPQFTGSRYRLRLNITDAQRDSILSFVRTQLYKQSSWNALKSFPESLHAIEDYSRRNWADNSHWYCTLLIWQAVFYVTGIDLDSNGGFYVYPNDIIRSPYFDNTQGFDGRSRF
jgi:hypothetical protein